MKVMLDHGAKMPTKAHKTDAGYDVYAAQSKYIAARGSAEVDIGVHIEIPSGYFGLIAGRSGMNFKQSIICPQGTIDSGYTGSIKVKLYNMSAESKMIEKGDRIAQIIFIKCSSPKLEQVDRLDDSERGESGFGSTGT